MENKFCLKSRQELAEIKQAKEEKKSSMSEISDELKDNALKARYARLRKANDDHLKAMFRKVDGAEEVDAMEKDVRAAEKEMETQGKKIDRHLALRRKAQSESVVNENEGTKYRVMILTKENDDVVEYFEYDNESEALRMFNEFAKQLEDGGDDSWAYVLAEYGSDENAWYPLDSTFSESKIDEISDTTAMTAYNKRVGNVQKALKNFKTADTKVNKLFKTVDGAEKRPDVEKAMATREKRAEEFDVADKKMAKMHDLYAKRNARKVQSESLTASKALAMSKSILDEISDELANKTLEKTVKETVKSNFSDEAADKEQKMIKQMILRKKRQGKELDQNEKEFLAKSESKINENESILETIKEDIMNAVKERYGDDPDMLDWIYVDVERREDGYVRVELRAELDYEGMDNLIDYLNLQSKNTTSKLILIWILQVSQKLS